MPQASGRVYSSVTLMTFLLCLVATVMHIVAFSSPYWLVSDGNSPFLNIGFHQVCFDNCHHPYCPGGDPDINYNDCFDFSLNWDQLRNDYNFQELYTWLFPDWFMTCRNIFIIQLPLSIACCIVLLVTTCFAFTARYKPESPWKKDMAAVILLYVSLLLLVTACLLNVSGIAIFATNGPRRDYMPMAYRNSFGFSFWLDFAVCLIFGFCGFTVFVAAVAKTVHIQGPRDARYADDMMLGRGVM